MALIATGRRAVLRIALSVLTAAAATAQEASDASNPPEPVAFDSRELLALIDPVNHVPPEERYTVVEWDGPALRPILYEQQDFEKLEHILQEYRETPLLDYGSPLYHYAVNVLSEIREDISHKDQRDVLDAWCRASDSHMPWLVRGAFNYEDGFRIRGSGWASEVPDEAWPDFHKRIEWAESDILHAAELDPREPEIFARLILIDTYGSKPMDVMEGHFKTATDLDPGYYPAWYNKLWYLLPRWHGSHEMAREHVERATALAEQHPHLYNLGLSYIDIVRGESPDAVDWSDPALYGWIRTGFEQRIARHPDSVLLKLSFALYAYRAEDWTTAVKLMDTIGDRYAKGSGWRSVEVYNRDRARTYLKLDAKSPARTWELATRALELAPDDYYTVYAAAYRTRHLTHDFETSRALAEHAIALKPDYAPSRWLLAVELCSLGRYDESIEAAEAGLKYAKGEEFTRRLERVMKQAQRGKRLEAKQ